MINDEIIKDDAYYYGRLLEKHETKVRGLKATITALMKTLEDISRRDAIEVKPCPECAESVVLGYACTVSRCPFCKEGLIEK